MKFEWEFLFEEPGSDSFSTTKRAKVFGGWLVKIYVHRWDEHGEDHSFTDTLTFVPDPKHEWVITEFVEVNE